MRPALSIGYVQKDTNLDQIVAGEDRYESHILSNYPELQNGNPCAFIQVGRQVQPIGLGYFHTGTASE